MRNKKGSRTTTQAAEDLRAHIRSTGLVGQAMRQIEQALGTHSLSLVPKVDEPSGEEDYVVDLPAMGRVRALLSGAHHALRMLEGEGL